MLRCARGKETKQMDQQTSVCTKRRKGKERMNELTLYLHKMWYTGEKIKTTRAKQITKKKLSKM